MRIYMLNGLIIAILGIQVASGQDKPKEIPLPIDCASASLTFSGVCAGIVRGSVPSSEPDSRDEWRLPEDLNLFNSFPVNTTRGTPRCKPWRPDFTDLPNDKRTIFGIKFSFCGGDDQYHSNSPQPLIIVGDGFQLENLEIFELPEGFVACRLYGFFPITNADVSEQSPFGVALRKRYGDSTSSTEYRGKVKDTTITVRSVFNGAAIGVDIKRADCDDKAKAFALAKYQRQIQISPVPKF